MTEVEDLLAGMMAATSKSSDKLVTSAQSALENPRLEFRDGQFFFRMTNLEGGVIERYVSDAAVREAFSKIPIDSGWLRLEIARWGDGKHGEWAVAFFAPGIHELEVTHEVVKSVPSAIADGLPATANDPPAIAGGTDFALDRLSVPLPGLVWFGTGTNYFIWAVKTEQLDPYQEIWRAPLPNVYTDGKVCWGLVKPPRANARSIFQAWELFITSTFNNHLASGKSKRAKDDVRGVLREASGQWAVGGEQLETRDPTPGTRYPIEDLVRQVDHVGITLDTALRKFMETGEMPE